MVNGIQKKIRHKYRMLLSYSKRKYSTFSVIYGELLQNFIIKTMATTEFITGKNECNKLYSKS